MCSIEGACDAPMPPTTLAIRFPALAHLPADLGERRSRHTRELDHHVDRHPVAPEPDPIAPAQQVFLFLRQAELLHPGLLVAAEELALVLVLKRVGGFVEADAAHRGRLVEEVELGGQVLRLDGLQPAQVVVRQFHWTSRWWGDRNSQPEISTGWSGSSRRPGSRSSSTRHAVRAS